MCEKRDNDRSVAVSVATQNGGPSQRCVRDRGEQGKRGFNWPSPPPATSNNIWAPSPWLDDWPEKGYSGQIDRVIMASPRELKGMISSVQKESLKNENMNLVLDSVNSHPQDHAI